jgi:hypothetical protein
MGLFHYIYSFYQNNLKGSMFFRNRVYEVSKILKQTGLMPLLLYSVMLIKESPGNT